jgi:hypothetical protein
MGEPSWEGPVAAAGDVVAESRGNVLRLILPTLVGGAFCYFWSMTVLEELHAGSPPMTLLFVVPLSVWLCWQWATRLTDGVVLRADGAERTGILGRAWKLRWEEVPVLHYSVFQYRLEHLIPLGRRLRFAAADADGRKLAFPNALRDEAAFVDAAVRLHAGFHLPPMRAALLAGGTLQFGKSVQLSKDELTLRTLFGLRKQRLARADYGGFKLRFGFLRFQKRGAIFSFGGSYPASVPNLFLLLTLLAGAQQPPSSRELGLS